MADEKKAPSMELEISVDGGSRTSGDFSNPDKPDVVLDGDDGVTLEFGPDGEVRNLTLDPEAEVDVPGGEEGGEETTEDKPEDAPEVSDLPEYNGADEEVYKSYEDRVFTFDAEGKGTLNMDALSDMWDANDGFLPEGVYSFLTDATGISKEAVKEIEAGRVALREKAEGELYSGFEGGKAGYDTAFKWATEGSGYTAEQKARFNAVMDGKDPAAIKEAYELLRTRHAAATGKASPGTERRRASPRRAVSSEAAPQASGVKPFANNAEYVAEAKAKGFNNKEVRQRLEASNFWKSQG